MAVDNSLSRKIIEESAHPPLTSCSQNRSLSKNRKSGQTICYKTGQFYLLLTDPFLCALLVAKTIEYASYKSSALADIAGKYAETGQKEKATQILSQALETAKTIEDANDKSRALADIAGEYAKAGQKEKANQILSQALETAKTIGDADDKSRALADIAGKYANAGKKPNKEAMVHMHGIVYEANPMAIMKIWE